MREVSTASHNHTPSRNYADAGANAPDRQPTRSPPSALCSAACATFLPATQLFTMSGSNAPMPLPAASEERHAYAAAY